MCIRDRSKAKQLEDYALLIYPSDQPEYEIIKHKNGVQSSVVTKTTSSAIKSGSAPNVLEVRIRGAELSFYANGQFLTLSLIHISEPTRQAEISYAVFCLKK